MLQVVLGTWVVLLVATASSFAVVVTAQALVRAGRAVAGVSPRPVLPTVEPAPVEQRSAA